MKYCINCGKKIDNSTKFCPYCGKKQSFIKSTEPKSRPHYKISKNGIKYVTDNDIPSKQKSKHTKVALITLVALVFIGLIIFGGFKIYNRMQMVNLPSNMENRTITYNAEHKFPPITLHMHTNTITIDQNFGNNDKDTQNYNIIGVRHTNIDGSSGTKLTLRSSNSHSPLDSIFLSNRGQLYTQTNNNSMYPRNRR